MGKLTTHVLDIASGIPARGIALELHRLGSDGTTELLLKTTTNADGRCDAPLLEGEQLLAGRYALTFHVAAYFAARDPSLPDPPFIDEVTLRFGIASPTQHYHVPLLVSPWSYSTYRGS